jgi:hypothetical protein
VESHGQGDVNNEPASVDRMMARCWNAPSESNGHREAVQCSEFSRNQGQEDTGFVRESAHVISEAEKSQHHCVPTGRQEVGSVAWYRIRGVRTGKPMI